MKQRDGHDLGRFASSIIAFAVIAVGVPIGLVAVARSRFGSANPLAGVDPPWNWFAEGTTSLGEPIADDTFIDAMVRASLCVIWIAVAVIVVTTVLEVAHLIRHRGISAPDIRGLGWAQRIARFIAIGLLVVLPSVTASPSIAASIPAGAAARAPATAKVFAPIRPAAGIAATATATPTDADDVGAPDVARAGETSADTEHVVRPGESVYSIAEHLAAGSGHSTIEVADAILDANLGTTMGPGERFTNPAYIQPGWVLQIPAGVVGPAGAVSATDPVANVGTQDAETPERSVGPYAVRRGDTLWDIADAQLGDAMQWRSIWERNAGRDMGGGRTFDDPDLILPGWELHLTEAAEDMDIAEDVGGTGARDHSEVAQPEADSGEAPSVSPPPDRLVADAPATDTSATDTGAPADEPVLSPNDEAPVREGDWLDADGPAVTNEVDTDTTTAADVPDVPDAADRSDAVTTAPTSTVDRDAPILVDPASTDDDVSASSPPTTADADTESDASDTGGPIIDLSEPLPSTPSTAPADSTPTDTSTSVPAVGGSNGDAGGDPTSSPAPEAPSPIRLEHAALLAAGVLALVAVRRRQRLRAARPRHRVPEPRPEVVDTERRLRAVDAGERALRVDVACRAAAWSLTETGAQIGWVEVSTDGDVELRLTAPAELPAPWTGSGQAWRLGAEVPIELLSDDARQVAMPCVAFVQIGVTPEGGEVLTDLEACGTLAVEATPKQADEVITAIAAGLASSLYAEVAHLIGVSLSEAALLGHRNAHVVGSTDAAFDLAASLVGTTVVNERTSFELRSLRTGGEMWEPAVVVLTSGDNAAEVVQDRSMPAPGHGLGVVVASDVNVIPGVPTRILAESDGWVFEGFGSSIEFTPIGLTAADLAAIDEVLVDADRELESMELVAADEVRWEDTPAVGTGPLAGITGGSDTSSDDDHSVAHAADEVAANEITDDAAEPNDDGQHLDIAPFEPMPFKIVVGLLGGVEIVDRDGTPGSFERSKTVELIAWLATHRGRSTRTGARTALWEMDVRDATFANVVSEARRAMARLVLPAEGEEWVARTLTEQLPIHDAVVTDAQLVEERLEHARLQPPAAALETLRPAVALIRDMPFAGTSYLWPDAEGITSNLVLLAITAATEFAGHALSLGDTDGVFWATGQGLRVLPGHEELIGLRMQAHARAGDLAGVRQEWEAYERVLVADAWSDGEPAPKLLDLRRELLSL